jgi:hypothetical protein
MSITYAYPSSHNELQRRYVCFSEKHLGISWVSRQSVGCSRRCGVFCWILSWGVVAWCGVPCCFDWVLDQLFLFSYRNADPMPVLLQNCRGLTLLTVLWNYDGVGCWTAQSKSRKTEFKKTQNPVETHTSLYTLWACVRIHARCWPLRICDQKFRKKITADVMRGSIFLSPRGEKLPTQGTAFGAQVYAEDSVRLQTARPSQRSAAKTCVKFASDHLHIPLNTTLLNCQADQCSLSSIPFFEWIWQNYPSLSILTLKQSTADLQRLCRLNPPQTSWKKPHMYIRLHYKKILLKCQQLTCGHLSITQVSLGASSDVQWLFIRCKTWVPAVSNGNSSARFSHIVLNLNMVLPDFFWFHHPLFHNSLQKPVILMFKCTPQDWGFLSFNIFCPFFYSRKPFSDLVI